MKARKTSMTNEILSLLEEPPRAFALINGIDGIEGNVTFYDYQGKLVMIYQVNHLPKSDRCQGGIFGFHIHEGGSCSGSANEPFAGTKGHFNPGNCPHPYHLGDLPPLFATQRTAWGMVYLDKLNVEEIMGKTIVIHNRADDFQSQPSGNSGEKIACGFIQRFSLIQPREK